MNDLLFLDVGKIYRKLIASDPEQQVYGYLPLMASASFGQVCISPSNRELSVFLVLLAGAAAALLLLF